ncbi:phage tail tape measure protein, partial [Sphaerisporangium aureirubrum]
MEGLAQIAVVGGQLGVAKEEMLGFVEATDQAVVALGDEFKGGAEEVAKEIGSLQKLFKETSKLKPGEAIQEIGSALNELGASGSATAPSVAEFTKRIGALGNLAPEINQTLGLGAAFEELGLSAEISSGGLTNILLTATKETAAFAKQLGMTEKEF